MNAFYQHHRPQIRFHYRCFDRLLLNAVVQPFQQPERVVGFFSTYRKLYPVSRQVLRDIASQFHNWVIRRAAQWEVPIFDAPPGRRDEFVARFFHRAKPDRVVVILKAREPARILVSIGSAATNRYHLTIQQRWVHQYNFYINDAGFGRLFVRVCPYFPFSARVCLNQHWWIAQRLKRQRIRFAQCANAFVRCADPRALQQIADSLQPQDVLACAHKWLAYLVPFFTARERKHAGCQHRIFFAQVEYCDNLIFRQRTALDRLGDRLLDANRTIGQPNKLTLLFGRKVTKRYRGKLQTVIEDLNLPNPVMRSHYGNGFIKQYVRDRWVLRTEAATNNVRDYGVPKAIEHLPALRAKLRTITDNYLAIQQDILETFIDRGQLDQLTTATVTAGGSFSTADLHAPMAKAVGCSVEQLSLGAVRYELTKLRAKGLVEKLPHSRRYQLTPLGYRLCVVFLKLFHKLYAPLAAAIVRPIASDRRLPRDRRTKLDDLYTAVTNALDELAAAVGLKAA